MQFDVDGEVDECLWPLTGQLTTMNWESLTEELRVRRRLAEILAHVQELHVRPRLRQLPTRATRPLTEAITASVIAGPESAPPWEQTLKEPVPRALREEWTRLAEQLRDLQHHRSSGHQNSR